MTRTPEEIAALRAKHAADNAAKAEKRAAKKAKYGDKNAEANMPVVEMNVPWVTSEGMEIDLDSPPWDSLPDALERNYRECVYLSSGKWPEYAVKRRINRT